MASSQETLITCKRCSNKVPVREMKYDMNGRDLICGRCYELKVASSQKPSTAGQYAERPKLSLEFTDPLEAKREVKYFCT
ncbi:hypothetical protein FJZ26_06330, partial [Candidatus Parvarchaeota archaeon]|nr:hypothetical protein [Candidatus Parvarchaeota archaeon]